MATLWVDVDDFWLNFQNTWHPHLISDGIVTLGWFFGFKLHRVINDPLKNVCQIKHARHRSPANFRVYLMAGLAAYAK